METFKNIINIKSQHLKINISMIVPFSFEKILISVHILPKALNFMIFTAKVFMTIENWSPLEGNKTSAINKSVR